MARLNYHPGTIAPRRVSDIPRRVQQLEGATRLSGTYIEVNGVRWYGGTSDPDVDAPNGSVWIDSSTAPPTIRGRANDTWVPAPPP